MSNLTSTAHERGNEMKQISKPEFDRIYLNALRGDKEARQILMSVNPDVFPAECADALRETKKHGWDAGKLQVVDYNGADNKELAMAILENHEFYSTAPVVNILMVLNHTLSRYHRVYVRVDDNKPMSMTLTIHEPGSNGMDDDNLGKVLLSTSIQRKKSDSTIKQLRKAKGKDKKGGVVMELFSDADESDKPVVVSGWRGKGHVTVAVWTGQQTA